MACPMQQNIDTKQKDKLMQHQQLSFTIVPISIGVLGGGMKKTMNDLTKLLTQQELVVKTAAEMQKTILMDSETLLGKVFSGFGQSATEEKDLFPDSDIVMFLLPLKSHNAFVFDTANLTVSLIIHLF